MTDHILISFYGDDFTGSTDVMESLSLNGIPTALFLMPPSLEEVQSFRLKNTSISKDGKLSAFGVAGIARSLSPEQMDRELPQIFEKIASVPSRFFHYKICSTFDSSPEVGNIGHAVELAAQHFTTRHIPLIVGIPFLNRFCVFGNLFATVGQKSYRIDRHPTMSKHPITPMDEADLTKHLAKQTKRHIQTMNVLDLEDAVREERYTQRLADPGFILFDVMEQRHLKRIGEVIDRSHQGPQQLIVGSSAVGYALSEYWQQRGLLQKPAYSTDAKNAAKYMIVAGSCSPRTAEQIRYGLQLGYSAVPMDTEQLLQNRDSEIARCTEKCIQVLSQGGTPMLYSALGPDDPIIQETKKRIEDSHEDTPIGALLGGAQGNILKRVMDQLGRLRVCVAGGDTSGYVSKSLEIYALEILVPMAPGSPLCIAHSRNPEYDGLEIALKGGQNGTERFFEFVALGKAET